MTISDNTVVTRHRNGIFIGGVTGLTAERNQVRTFTGAGGTSIPNIVLGGMLTGDRPEQRHAAGLRHRGSDQPRPRRA